MRKRKIKWGVRTTVTVMITAIIGLVLLGLYVFFSSRIIPQTRENLENKALTIARTIALIPFVQEGLETGSSREIQDYASRITRRNHILFVVVTDMNGIRYSHPNPEVIGRRFQGGGLEEALHGGESVSEGKGTLGESIRAFVPVYSGKGRQLGVVVVGLSRERVSGDIRHTQWVVILALLSGAMIGGLGAVALAGRVKKMMHWLEPSDISNMLEERSAILQSATEGIIAVNERGDITLVNLEAERLLRAAQAYDNPLGRNIAEFWPALRLEEVLTTGQATGYEEISLNGLTLLARGRPVRVGGHTVGAVSAFRDMTEVVQLAERLSGVSVYAEALRGQAHEFRNKLHVIMGMTHMKMYDELQEYVAATVDSHQNEIGAITRSIKDPVMAGFVLGKLSRGREAGIVLQLDGDSYLPPSRDPEVIHELITIAGNLLDNAIEALQRSGTDGKIRLAFRYGGGRLACTVADNGPGIPEDIREVVFRQGFSTKGENRGIGLFLVRRSVERLGGRIALDSRKGGGTVFTVELPYAAKEGDEA